MVSVSSEVEWYGPRYDALDEDKEPREGRDGGDNIAMTPRLDRQREVVGSFAKVPRQMNDCPIESSLFESHKEKSAWNSRSCLSVVVLVSYGR